MKGKKSAVVVLVAVALLLAGTVIGARAMLTGNEQQPAMDQKAPSAGLPAEEVGSLAEAEAVLGTPIPLPAYLPSGYEVQQIYVGGTWHVALLFSNEEIVPCSHLDSAIATWEKEFQRAGGARLVLDMQRVETAGAPDMWEDVEAGRTDIPGDVVNLGQVKGLLVDPREIDYPSDHQVDDIWYLEWAHSKFRFTLKAPKGLPREEVIRIASSVPVVNVP